MIPTFIGLGAERSATTWMYQCLREHSEVFMPDEKELHFFSRRFDKGLQCYQEQFSAHNGQKAVGEFSPEYIFVADVPHRIHSTMPEVRLIASLRNPIDRAFSEYGWEMLRAQRSITFEEFLKCSPQCVEKGFYAEQLERYYHYFPREQMLILIYEDILKNPRGVVEQIYHFLGVNETFVPPGLHLKQNRGMTKRDGLMAQILLPISRIMRSPGRWDVITRTLILIRHLLLTERLIDYTVNKFARSSLNARTREMLRAEYENSNLRLAELINRDVFLLWS